MKGWSKTVNRGKSGARKKQSASGDHSVSRVKQKKGPEAKKSSLGFGGNKIDSMDRKLRDNIGGKIKAPREGCGD
jgi:hypothetical protein